MSEPKSKKSARPARGKKAAGPSGSKPSSTPSRKKQTAKRAKKGPRPSAPLNQQMQVAVRGLLDSVTQKSKDAQLIMDQLVNPATAPLLRVNPGGNQASTVKSGLCRLPVRMHFDLKPLLSTAEAVGPMVIDGDETFPVWSYGSASDPYAQFILTDDPVVPLIFPVAAANPNKTYSIKSWTAGVQDIDGRIEMARCIGVNATATSGQAWTIPLGGSYWVNPGGDLGDRHPIGRTQDGVFYTWIDASPTYPATINISGSWTYTPPVAVTGVNVVAAIYSGSSSTGAALFTDLYRSPAADVGAPDSNAVFIIELRQSGYFSFRLQGGVTFTNSSPNQVVYFNPNSSLTRYTYSTSVVSRHVSQESMLVLGEAGVVASNRVLGTACLFSNTTPHLYQGGSSVGYCASGNSDFWWQRTTDVPAIETVNDEFYFRQNWTKGIYAYVKPRKYGGVVECRHEVGRRVTYNGDFADPYGWSMIMIQPSIGTATTLPLVLQLHQAHEYWTDNPVFQLDCPKTSIEAYEVFLSAASRLGHPFSCNPGHLALIMNAIRQAARTAGEYLMPIFETGTKFSRALQSETPFSSSLSVLGL